MVVMAESDDYQPRGLTMKSTIPVVIGVGLVFEAPKFTFGGTRAAAPSGVLAITQALRECPIVVHLI
jgi:hypothetical protein